MKHAALLFGLLLALPLWILVVYIKIPGPAHVTVGQTGPIGLKGPVGPLGLVGPTGSKGPKGPKGLRGLIGMTGPSGPVGYGGPTGPTGPVGSIGPTGVSTGLARVSATPNQTITFTNDLVADEQYGNISLTFGALTGTYFLVTVYVQTNLVVVSPAPASNPYVRILLSGPFPVNGINGNWITQKWVFSDLSDTTTKVFGVTGLFKVQDGQTSISNFYVTAYSNYYQSIGTVIVKQYDIVAL
jgi:hypothetical protein